jgi:hypothetical protein
MIAQALSPVLWAQHRPDRFDTWSAGITLMCLVVPSLRTPRGLAQFLKDYERAGYDLDRWRQTTRSASARDLAVLDADDGAGWGLAQALLRPRSIEVGDDGSVSFISNGGAPQRISATEALRHRFLRGAAQLERERGWGSASGSTLETDVEEASPSGSRASSGGRRATAVAPAAAARAGGSGGGRAGKSPAATTASSAGAPAASAKRGAAGGGLFGAAASMLRGLTDTLFDLEARILQTASDTATQTTTVRKLEAKVAKGQADAKQLEAEKQKLGRMQKQLDTLEAEASVTQRTANRLFGFLGLGGGGGSGAARAAAAKDRERQAEEERAAAAAAEAAADKKGGASQVRGSGVPGAPARRPPSPWCSHSQRRPSIPVISPFLYQRIESLIFLSVR